VTPPENRNHAEEANKLNEFIIVESEGFFERMLGGAKPSAKKDESNDDGSGQNG
jgi:hypothetical protein